MEKKQKIRFTDTELSVIKSSFAVSENDNDDLARALRKVMLQMPLDPIDVSILATIREQKELLAVIRKTFLPTLDSNAPFHQLIDMWLTVPLKDRKVEEAYTHLKSMQIVIDYKEQQLTFLEKGIIGEIELTKLGSLKGKQAERAYVEMLARNTIIQTTEMDISQLIILAGLKDETTDETMKRLEKDSMK